MGRHEEDATSNVSMGGTRERRGRERVASRMAPSAQKQFKVHRREEFIPGRVSKPAYGQIRLLLLLRTDRETSMGRAGWPELQGWRGVSIMGKFNAGGSAQACHHEDMQRS